MQGLTSWFARNGVVANLLMILIIAVGLMTTMSLRLEVFPEISVDIITVSVEYRGAAPEEVEEGVCVRVEEAVQDLDGIKKLTSSASEGMGTVTIEVETGYDTREVLDDVKSRVDAIDTFPEETEKPVIQELTNRFQVINVSIAGDADELTLKRLGEQVRDELTLLPEITQVELKNARPYEISIEVSEEALRRHGLTFDAVAQAVRSSSLDLPGGSVKTASGEILLRTKGQAYRGPEFERLTLMTRPDGSKLQLSDVARVVDGFEDTDQAARLDGMPAVLVQVYRVGDQNALEVVAAVKKYVAEARARLPEGIKIITWADTARILESRMDLLIRNAMSGLVLVFIILALFLRLRLAFWVTLGIPISFLGAIAMMPQLDVSINMISLFSFILVLGIVVDDAIVIGENIFSKQREAESGIEGAVSGVQEVMIPVIFGVLTTVAAFAPMLFVPGNNGKIWRVIPCIVIPTLLFSLVESQLILPSHLAHQRPKKKRGRPNLVLRAWTGFFDFFENGLNWFIQKIYRPALNFAVEWRYLTLAAALATLALTFGLVGGGLVKFVFFPVVESDNIVANLTMPMETPVEVTAEAMRRLEASAAQLEKEIKEQTGGTPYEHVLTSVGEQPFRTQASRNAGARNASYSGAHLGEVNIELTPSEQRTITSSALAARWRDITGGIPGAVELTFTSDLMGGGKAIDIQLAGSDIEELRQVAAEIKTQLSEYPGVIDISDSFRGGKPEVKLDITSEAESLGLTRQDLGRQVRQGFFGEEAQRIQRGRDDIRVMVRYPEQQRKSLGDLESMRVRTPDGGEVPFSTVANAAYGRGFATITRVDRQRAINVTAEVDEAVANANELLADLGAGFLPQLLERHPSVQYSLEGEQRDQMESVDGLFRGFGVAMFAIYAMMAIPFRSYLQPLIVMSAIPFGIVGAIWGHIFLGLDVSLLSLCGVIALAGVAVNDSLVLVTFVNAHREQTGRIKKSVIEAGVTRFRPILLTSLTTAAGVTPLMLERSVQAQFLIPMAVALAFGVLFSTFITLGLVPALYVILEDFQKLVRWAWGTEPDSEDYATATAAVPDQAVGSWQPVAGGATSVSPNESPAYREIGHDSTARRLRTLRPQEDEPGGD
ncbi:MAG: efflux RND transporter permease subunit [Bryobacterales bacterium]